MSESRTVTLETAASGHAQWVELWRWCKAMLIAGHRLTVTVKKATRSTDQNALLHKAISEIAKQVEWAGKRRSPETWKRLLVAAWLRAKNEHVEVLPAIDGHGVDVVFERTSRLTVAECSDLMEFVFSWAAQNSVELD